MRVSNSGGVLKVYIAKIVSTSKGYSYRVTKYIHLTHAASGDMSREHPRS